MENLKAARIRKHLTQEQLGMLVNVQKSAISKYERGAIQPSKEILLKLSEVLDVSIDYLLGREPSPDTGTATTVTDEDVKVALFGGDGVVTDEMWDEVTSFVEFVKQKHKKEKKESL